jgi:hypothetical protein
MFLLLQACHLDLGLVCVLLLVGFQVQQELEDAP